MRIYQQVLDMGGPAVLEHVLGSTLEEAFGAWSGRGVSGLKPDSAKQTVETGRAGERSEGEKAKKPKCRPSRERLMGFEPTTFCMASRRSSQLSYSRARR
jgi:hypothetical protein